MFVELHHGVCLVKGALAKAVLTYHTANVTGRINRLDTNGCERSLIGIFRSGLPREISTLSRITTTASPQHSSKNNQNNQNATQTLTTKEVQKQL